MRTWCDINLAALRHNLLWLRSLASEKTGVVGLVKANAYGHGMIPVARFLEKERCEIIGCAHVHEARRLREAGIRKPILLFSAFLAEELPEIIRLRAMVALSSLEEARQAQRTAKRLRKKLGVHVKIDTGMGRLGVLPSRAKALLKAVQELDHLELQGVFTHFACPDNDAEFTRVQWSRFKPFLADYPRHHSSSSAAILRKIDPRADFIRPGLSLYGISPIPRWQKYLKPVLTWKTRVTLVKTMPAGSTLSYGASYRTTRPEKIAVLAVGYGDGYFRLLSNQAHVLIGGKRCPVRGRVTMDQILVDVSRVRGVKSGDEAVLIGRQKKEEILASELAALAQTIPYEIWCHITDRVPRVYKTRAEK